MFESGSNVIELHMEKVEFYIPESIQNPTDLTVFRIGRIAMFPLDSIMYEDMELALSQNHQALYIP